MDILIINNSNNPVNTEIINYFVNNSTVEAIHILEGKEYSSKSHFSNGNSFIEFKVKFIQTDLRNKFSLAPVLEKIFSSSESPPLVLYCDPVLPDSEIKFSEFDIMAFKKYLDAEILKKIYVFQSLVSCLRPLQSKTNILVLIQPYAQTSLTSSQVDRNILFSSLHMLTTAFSDEFVEKGIYCNGILADEHMLKTLEWFLSVNKDNFYGKLFSNKKIINW